MKKFIILTLLPVLIFALSPSVWANASKLNAQERQLLGKWLCHFDFKDSDFASHGYYHIEYLADKSYIHHEVSKATMQLNGQTISGLSRYGAKGEWWVDDTKIYERTAELFKYKYDPALDAIPYWAESAEPDGIAYTEQIKHLDRTQLITLQEVDDSEAEMVCRRL